MHSGLWAWRRAMRASRQCGGGGEGEGDWTGCGPHPHHWERPTEEGFDGGFGGGLGVRRPLRFLVHKLGLEERQVTELAKILNELKTERAQAEVDRHRTVASLADALASEAFDTAKANEGGALRVKSAERLREAVLKALQQIHGILNPEQRVRLAYLIRTGALVI